MPPLSTLATQLKQNTTACRVSIEWLGVRKALTATERSKAAEPFDADKNYLSASAKLIDTKHPAYANLTSIKNEAVAYWKANTLPYIEDGVRLIQKTKVGDFNDTMATYEQKTKDAVEVLDDHWQEIRSDAEKKLGALYNSSNYPTSIKTAFAIKWDFPSIDPPEYLAQLAPGVYAQEIEKIQAKMQEAVTLAEEAFLVEFKKMVDHLHDVLTPSPDGTKKIFRDSAVTNLSGFFKRFKELTPGSTNEALDQLINEAQDLVKGIDAQELRDHQLLKTQIAGGLKDIGAKLEPLVTNLPRRKIIKPPTPTEAAHETATAIPA